MSLNISIVASESPIRMHRPSALSNNRESESPIRMHRPSALNTNLGFLRSNAEFLNTYLPQHKRFTTRIRTVNTARVSDIAFYIYHHEHGRNICDHPHLERFVEVFLGRFYDSEYHSGAVSLLKQSFDIQRRHDEQNRERQRQQENQFQQPPVIIELLARWSRFRAAHSIADSPGATIENQRSLSNNRRRFEEFIEENARILRQNNILMELPERLRVCVARFLLLMEVDQLADEVIQNRNFDSWAERMLTRENIKVSSWKEEKPDECPVCCGECCEKPLSCGHYVCVDCVVKSKKTSCPCCRQEVDLDVDVLRKIFDNMNA